MLFHLMHLYANFEMGHFGTFEFNPQTLPTKLPTSPQIYPFKPTTPKKACNGHPLCSKIVLKSVLIQP
jgi:hypothetical protein